MPADHTPDSLPDSRPLFRLIAQTRRLLRSSWVLTGLGLTLGLLLAALATMTLMDLFLHPEPITLPFFQVVVPLDPVLRLLALVLIVVPAALAFVQGVVRPLCRRLGPTHVARRIESHLPGIHNRLVSAIDLESRRDHNQSSAAFLRRLLQEALARVRSFKPFTVVDRRSLGRASLFAVLSVGACLLVGLVFGDHLPTTLRRIFLPLADIPPASSVAYTVQPGQADVLRDEEITFTAEVTRGDPRELRLELYGPRGLPKKYDLKPDRNDPNHWKVTVDAASLGAGFEKNFTYRIYGGWTWSPQYTINIVERPVLANVETAVHLPAYMRLPEAIPTPPQAVEVIGPEGKKDDLAHIEVIVRSQGQVAEGEIQLLEPDTRRIPRDRQQERVWFEDKIPVGATEGGSWDWQKVEKRTVHVDPTGLGTRAHWFQGDPVGQIVSKGDVLFAWVRLPASNRPETLMLEWHDGDSWEHRAYWGAERIKEGRSGTASRCQVGGIPAGEKWVRLEVPASKVGLEGKTIRGMAFKLHGGQAQWGRTGLVQVEEPGVRVTKTFALKKVSADLWKGKFPLTGSGLFRAELRNPARHPNKPMKELKFVAIPDKAPYVTLDRQGVELVLSKPAPVPLTISAFDDWGVEEVVVIFPEQGGKREQRRVLQTLAAGAKPERTVNLVASLDEAGKLKMGEGLRYLIEARDTRGQTARTQEYSVRIANDGNAADKKLENFDKTQDTFLDRLAKLIGEQKKITGSLEKAEKEYAELEEKLKARAEEAKVEDKAKPEEKGRPAEKQPDLKLSPDEAKRLAELQKELAKLAGEQNRNAETARQMNEELKRSVDEAGKLELMPKPLVDELKGTQRLFDQAIAQAMKDLGRQLADNADSKKGPPDVKSLENKGREIDKNLEGLKNRLDALDKARKGLKDDVQKALNELREKMMREDAKLTARDLEELKNFIEKLREQLKSAAGKQDDASRETAEGDLPKARAKQEDIEKELENLLERARKLLAKSNKEKRRPEFPDSPFRADDKENKIPPREEDTDDPLPTKKKADPKKDGESGETKKGGEKDKDMDEEESKFMPRLGGPKEKLDPRFDKKRRPVQRKPKGGKEREDLENRQNDNSRDLDSADKALASDQNTLEAMIEALKNAAASKGKGGTEGDQPPQLPGEGSELARQLREMLESARTREARLMAAAMKGLQAGMQRGQRQQGPPSRTPPATPMEGNIEGAAEAPGSGAADLAKLDPATRAMIMKMPPSRFRDELIQGLNERGPEAYEAFIQDYFKRLTESKK
jgi:hypothetical protein